MMDFPGNQPTHCLANILKADRLHPRDYLTHTPWTDNDSSLLFVTDGQTDATKYIISLASQSIIKASGWTSLLKSIIAL